MTSVTSVGHCNNGYFVLSIPIFIRSDIDRTDHAFVQLIQLHKYACSDRRRNKNLKVPSCARYDGDAGEFLRCS
jgi:hypothetical protein